MRAQSAKAACAAAVENLEGAREAVGRKDTLEAAQKASTAAWRAHSVRLHPSGTKLHAPLSLAAVQHLRPCPVPPLSPLPGLCLQLWEMVCLQLWG